MKTPNTINEAYKDFPSNKLVKRENNSTKTFIGGLVIGTFVGGLITWTIACHLFLSLAKDDMPYRNDAQQYNQY
jgi:hypothetical protein